MTDAKPLELQFVRKIGEGERAELYLARDGEHLVAAKRYRPTTPRVAIERELAALARAEGPHCIRLLDAAAPGRGDAPVAIVERLERGSLAALLDRRGGIRLGEAITILAPIASTLDELHRRGVQHGALGPAAVLFRQDGAPVLARFGHATTSRPSSAAARAEDPRVLADRRALADLVRTVLTHVPGLAATTIDDIAGGAAGLEAEDDAGARVAARLFALTAAEPVGFDAPAIAQPVPERPLPDIAVPRFRTHPLERLAALAPTSIVTRVAMITDAARRVRRGVWVVAAAGLAALLLSIVVIALPSSTEPRRPRPVVTAPSTVPAATPDARDGDDPLAALDTILDARSACLAALSTECLAAVDQAGSGAEDADRALVRALRGGSSGESAELTADGARVSQRLGDSVLVEVTSSTASEVEAVLMLRTAEGWRIRDYLTE